MTALQAAIVVLDAATLWAALRGIGEHAAPDVVFAAFVAASMAMALSPVPLGVGTFEAAGVAMLHAGGVGLEASLAATLVLRGFTTWLPMLPGLWLIRRELRGGNRAAVPRARRC